MQTNKELRTVASLLNTKQVWLKLKKSRGFDAAAVAQMHSGLFSPASQVIGVAPCDTEASARRCRSSKSKLNILIVRPGAVSLSCCQKPHRAVIAVIPRSIFCIWCLSCLMKLDQTWGLFAFAAQPNQTGLPAALVRLILKIEQNVASFCHFFVLFLLRG